MRLTRTVATLTLEGAKRLAEAAEREARARRWTVAVAVVDPSGGLVLFHALDGTQLASQEIAVAKARTAARFRRPTKALEDAIAGGRTALLGMHDAVPIEGGLPVTLEGRIVGAIGVSGMTSPEDGIIAAAALVAFASDDAAETETGPKPA